MHSRTCTELMLRWVMTGVQDVDIEALPRGWDGGSSVAGSVYRGGARSWADGSLHGTFANTAFPTGTSVHNGTENAPASRSPGRSHRASSNDASHPCPLPPSQITHSSPHIRLMLLLLPSPCLPSAYFLHCRPGWLPLLLCCSVMYLHRAPWPLRRKMDTEVITLGRPMPTDAV